MYIHTPTYKKNVHHYNQSPVRNFEGKYLFAKYLYPCMSNASISAFSPSLLIICSSFSHETLLPTKATKFPVSKNVFNFDTSSLDKICQHSLGMLYFSRSLGNRPSHFISGIASLKFLPAIFFEPNIYTVSM